MSCAHNKTGAGAASGTTLDGLPGFGVACAKARSPCNDHKLLTALEFPQCRRATDTLPRTARDLRSDNSEGFLVNFRLAIHGRTVYWFSN